MTPAEQELNIALCEWRGFSYSYDAGGDKYWDQPVPNHISDISSLGHVHEAEKRLTWQQTCDYTKRLEFTVVPAPPTANVEGQIWHATAKQRTIALLTVVNPEFIKTWKQKYPNE
jgi:hypothetical protein